MTISLRRLASLLAALLAFAAPAGAQPAAPAPAADYGLPASWLCRPGNETLCTTGLDTLVVAADGTRTPQPFVPAADPPIDCFYVYPTASHETTRYSDMVAGPGEQGAVRAQAGRLTSRCRLYAPLYRQLTLAGLRHDMASGERLDWRGPYADVLAAWRWYLAHDNAGRGVVLIGHSQGTILLQRLIAEEIDGKPIAARLVAAFLAGDPGLAVPRGGVVGGTFAHIPLCAAAAQTGCAYVWGSYLAGDAATDRHFGTNPDALRPDAPQVAGCDSPAAPGGGHGALRAVLPRPATAPATDPAWIELVGQLSAECVADDRGNVLRVTIEPGRFADQLAAGFARSTNNGGWGLHSLDLGLPQGNILDVVAAETATWQAVPRGK